MIEQVQKFSPSRGNETFVLVHGAWHGAWCWEKVERILHALGHKTVALDLPAHGNAPGNIREQTLQSYVDCVVAELDRHEQPVILVGHSMGGAVITMAAEARPEKIKKLVYLEAFLMQPGQSAYGTDGNAVNALDLTQYSEDGKTWPCSAELAAALFANNCSNGDVQYMGKMLVPEEAVEPLTAKVYPTEARWGSIRRFFIACANDVAMTPDVVRRLLAATPCEEAFEIQADHAAFYSAPEELAFVLNQIAIKP